MKRVSIAVIFMLLLVPFASAQNGPNPLLYQPNENIAGMSYGDWTATWWQWAMQYTMDAHPYMDLTGELCNQGQGGPVFYLAGSPTGSKLLTRTCTVPAGKALLIPLLNFECSTIEAGTFHANNGSHARVCADSWSQGHVTLYMTIDGRKIMDLKNYRFQSPYFLFNVPPDNNFTGTVGPTEGMSVSDGWWVMVKPLHPGPHVIRVYATMKGGLADGSLQNFKYVLYVTP